MSHPKNPCYLNALGIVSALGNDKLEVANNLFLGKQPGILSSDDWCSDQSVVVATVTGELPEISDEFSQYACRNIQLLLAAYEQIKAEVETAISKFGRKQVAIVLGSSTSGIAEGEEALKAYNQQGHFPANFHYKQQEIGASAEFLAEYLKLGNLAYTVSTACSSSAKAFASARLLLQQNVCDAVIVGGVDSLCGLTINGFSALESVSDKVCNPFSLNRNGITLGEGAALFLMTLEPSPISLVGVGESSDAYHISSPEPDGKGAELAIITALNDAGLTAEQIDYINLHGTATIKNDEMESRVIHRLFGDSTDCSSTKAQTGHALGAAGAIELALCWLTLSELNQQNLLPPQLWDNETDPDLPPLNFASTNRQLRAKTPNFLMSNSFAFGGSNASLIIGTAP